MIRLTSKEKKKKDRGAINGSHVWPREEKPFRKSDPPKPINSAFLNTFEDRYLVDEMILEGKDCLEG